MYRMCVYIPSLHIESLCQSVSVCRGGRMFTLCEHACVCVIDWMFWWVWLKCLTVLNHLGVPVGGEGVQTHDHMPPLSVQVLHPLLGGGSGQTNTEPVLLSCIMWWERVEVGVVDVTLTAKAEALIGHICWTWRTCIKKRVESVSIYKTWHLTVPHGTHIFFSVLHPDVRI